MFGPALALHEIGLSSREKEHVDVRQELRPWSESGMEVVGNNCPLAALTGQVAAAAAASLAAVSSVSKANRAAFEVWAIFRNLGKKSSF
jgi:hypothetical protein